MGLVGHCSPEGGDIDLNLYSSYSVFVFAMLRGEIIDHTHFCDTHIKIWDTTNYGHNHHHHIDCHTWEGL